MRLAVCGLCCMHQRCTPCTNCKRVSILCQQTTAANAEAHDAHNERAVDDKIDDAEREQVEELLDLVQVRFRFSKGTQYQPMCE